MPEISPTRKQQPQTLVYHSCTHQCDNKRRYTPKEILRLNHEGYSQRQLESSVHGSHHTVREILAVAEKQNLTWSLEDSVTGEITPAYLYITVLPYSCYVYAEATSDMKPENRLNCHVHAYEYFGVTRLLIPNHLKTCVT